MTDALSGSGVGARCSSFGCSVPNVSQHLARDIANLVAFFKMLVHQSRTSEARVAESECGQFPFAVPLLRSDF